MAPAPPPPATEARGPVPSLDRRVGRARIRLEAHRAEARELLAAQWARCLDEGGGVGGAAAPVRLPLSPQAGLLPPEQAERLASRVTESVLEAHAGRSLMFHAAALSDRRGRVVSLLGPSGMGKTTAAARLGAQGWGYVTDELTVVEPDLGVVAFPKPLCRVDPGRDDGAKTVLAPDALGLATPPAPLRLAALVLLERDPGHRGAPRLGRLEGVEALSALVDHSCALPRLERPVQRLASLVDTVGAVHVLRYASLGEVGPLLQEALDAPGHRPAGWRAVGAGTPAGRSGPGGDAPRWERVTVEDGVLLGDGTAALMLGARLLGISALAAAVWRAAGDGATREEMTRRVVEEMGPHPEAGRVVEEVVASLAAVGLLRPVGRAAGLPGEGGQPLRQPEAR